MWKCKHKTRCYKKDGTVGYFCESISIHSVPLIMPINDAGDFCMYGSVGDENSKVVSRKYWNELDVPNDCDFYAEYLVKELCDEQTI